MSANEEVKRNRRLGLRASRSQLLPPYLAINPYFMEYVDAIDEVFSTRVDDKIHVLENIRNMWVTNPGTEVKILNQEMLDFTDWSQPERDLLVKQVNMLGMKLNSAGVLTNNDYHMVSRFLGQYWFEKGTATFMEFMNFCLGTNFKVHNLWSRNVGDYKYHDLSRERNGQPPGQTIIDGGPWWPTTHVDIEAKDGLGDLDVTTLAEFFYEIANYNLVLNSIETTFDLYVVDELVEGKTDAVVVAIGLYYDPNVVISTAGRYGAQSPAVVSTVPSLPSRYMGVGVPNWDTAYTVTDPTSWFRYPNGDALMVFGPGQQAVSDSPSINLSVMADTSTTGVQGDPNGYVMLLGPVEWVPVPGSSRSKGRIPVWSAVPVELATGGRVSTRAVGYRNHAVANPKGWKEISPGKFSPYW